MKYIMSAIVICLAIFCGIFCYNKVRESKIMSDVIENDIVIYKEISPNILGSPTFYIQTLNGGGEVDEKSYQSINIGDRISYRNVGNKILIVY